MRVEHYLQGTQERSVQKEHRRRLTVGCAYKSPNFWGETLAAATSLDTEDKGTGTGSINKWVGIGELEDMYDRGRGGSFIPHLVSASYRAVLTQAKSRVILPSTPDQHPRQ